MSELYPLPYSRHIREVKELPIIINNQTNCNARVKYNNRLCLSLDYVCSIMLR